MSFSQEVKNELKNKSFTSKKRNSKIFDVVSEDMRNDLKDIFLKNGFISDPEKSYLLEFVFNEIEKAEETAALISSLGINCKVIRRKDSFVAYLKDSEAISDLLSFMGAHKSLMDYENMRIYKEMRENVQRQVNCETANLQKTVKASLRQIEDIEYIKKNLGFENLPDSLQEIAEARIEMPDATLSELAEALKEPVGKSGVNHRLRKLTKIANELRNDSEVKTKTW